ncbi:hypothetical protein K505DRAFT_309568 [Melanomma pulvis-pyrius CBS 109.77]|uniref:Heterokaryon incompatibility domain-containing protein n=1 Tax=Melanomma pulvis-pyrius CBS 109.77 TaxID=1314802 RepID=A0A6A6X536_9PLEO|nr:hypothetical protein K505DRAFT_309568 [Melanomma pulvis-pyrius CBS 109.77]
MDNSPSLLNPSVYSTPISSTSIRLLQFSLNQTPSQNRSDGSTCTFTGKLKKFRLQDAPPFYTASYVWGPKTNDQTHDHSTAIGLKSGTLPVLSSLTPFLNMVCAHKDFSEKDWWWIDSLCINLKDIQEREDQVKIMGQIYRNARRVIIWLGEEIEEGSDCTGATKFLFQLSNLPPAFRTNKALRTELLEPSFDAQWSAVGRLLARKWWARVWTLQEFVLPPEAKFYCGHQSISRGKFKSAMYNIHLCSTGSGDYSNELIPRHAFDAAFNRRRIHQWYLRSTGMSLVAIMAYLGNHSATDARDMIYSVLGLINEQDRRLVGPAEYKSSVQHIYAKLVRSFWIEYQNLDIICFSHMFNRHSGNLDLEQMEGKNEAVPSWAPDWRARVEFSSPVPLMASQSASEHIGNFRPLGSRDFQAMYDAPGPTLRKQANVRFHENLKEMWCDGVVLDAVDGLGGLDGCETRCRSYVCRDSGHEVVQSTQIRQDTDSSAVQSLRIIETVARSLTLNRRDKYLRYQAPAHYVSSFLVLCHACLNSHGDGDGDGDDTETERNPVVVDELFAIWFEQNQHLRFGRQTLAEHVTSPSYSFPPPSPTTKSHPGPHPDAEDQDQDPYLTRFHDTVRKKSRKLMVTTLGYVGMAPCRARQGDVVAVLFGCSIPLVLRRVGVREAWTVVGEAYVDGFMEGQVDRLVAGEAVAARSLRIV